MMPTAIMAFVSPGPRIAMTASAVTSPGIEYRTSTNRIDVSVDASADIPDQHADRDAEADREDDRFYDRLERHAGAEQGSAEGVATELVSAEPVVGARTLECGGEVGVEFP